MIASVWSSSDAERTDPRGGWCGPEPGSGRANRAEVHGGLPGPAAQ
jgi:hypothetical protein